MRRILIPAAIILLLTPAPQQAQGPAVESVEPFKVGTFDIHGVPHVGLVLRDSLVIDIEVAALALESHPEYSHVPMPEDMLELIGRWDYGLKYRLFEIVNYVVGNDQLTGSGAAPATCTTSASCAPGRRSCIRARSSTRRSISTAT